MRYGTLATVVFTGAMGSYWIAAESSVDLSKLHVVSNLELRLARLTPVQVPFSTAGLRKEEVQEVGELVEASRLLGDIYWRQIDPPALTLYKELTQNGLPPRNTETGRLAHYLFVNGSRYDLFEANTPFVGTEPIPPGRAFYPADLTRNEIETYVKQHPNEKAALYSPTTLVRRDGDKLKAIPYHVAFAEFLKPATDALHRAAALSNDAAFAGFLRKRADALLSDDYYPSDIAWLNLKSPRIDIIFAPYETYDDELLGLKATYGAAILIRNDVASQKLELFQRYVADIQDALPLAAEDRPSKHGLATPMEAADSPFRAADLRHGYQVVADNLPNDPRIHEEKGSKQIFFKNFQDARTEYVVLPVARQVMRPAQAALASGEGYLAAVMMHEICHGLGPSFARTPQGKRPINEAIGPGYSPLEEAKADVVGMFALDWLLQRDALPAPRREEYYASYLAGIFRSVRFGTAEAHSRAEMMEFNYLVEQGAVSRLADGRYEVVMTTVPNAIRSLAKELLTIEATGDRQRNEAWFAKYGQMPASLKESLDRVTGVPVDIDPVFSFAERVK
jgi:hypothetical protein